MTAFPKGRLEASEERFIPGAPLYACLPDEQVENTAESSWNDLAKQNPEPSISLSLVKRMGGY